MDKVSVHNKNFVTLVKSDVAPVVPRSSSIFDSVDTYSEKAILTTLLILDKATFISPIRWLFPTSSRNGERLEGGLVGCGGEEGVGKSIQNPPTNVCARDVDCKGVEVCKGGECLDPAKLRQEEARQRQAECLLKEEVCDNKDNNCDGRTDEGVCGDKIGDPCYPNPPEERHPLESQQCSTNQCISYRAYPGGYCTNTVPHYSMPAPQTAHRECPVGHNFRKSVCVKDSQLGIDTAYYQWRQSSYFCVVTCDANEDCRSKEGYVCKQIIDSAYKACLPQFEKVTIGKGICAD